MTEQFLYYRAKFLLLSQLLGGLICIYFIYNIQHYEVSWSLLAYYMPNFVNKINNGLALIGTGILVIPLSIIILSILIPESLFLRMASGFFGVAGTIWFCATAFFSKSIDEVYNMRIFVISKILSLDEKRVIFKAEFMRIIDDTHKTSFALYLHLQEHLTDKAFIQYDQSLLVLHNSKMIKLYALETVDKIVYLFTQNNVITQVHIYQKLLKATIIIVGVTAAVLLGAYLLRWFTETDALKTGAVLQKDSAILSQEGLNIMQSAQSSTRELTSSIAANVDQPSILIGKLVSEATTEGFQKTANIVKQLSDKVDIVSETVLKQNTRLDSFEIEIYAIRALLKTGKFFIQT